MQDSSGMATVKFTDLSLVELEGLSDDELDALPFGVVGLSVAGTVEVYNRTESHLAGLPFESVVGEHYFSSTAQCMNNYMVAQRFEDQDELDVVLDYVLTLRMRPTPVRLRLLKSASQSRRYILIER